MTWMIMSSLSVDIVQREPLVVLRVEIVKIVLYYCANIEMDI